MKTFLQRLVGARHEEPKKSIQPVNKPLQAVNKSTQPVTAQQSGAPSQDDWAMSAKDALSANTVSGYK